MKYLVIFWDAYGSTNEGEETWAVYWWGTNKKEARSKYVEAKQCLDSPDVRLVETNLLAREP